MKLIFFAFSFFDKYQNAEYSGELQ